jgi:hypothetical protein
MDGWEGQFILWLFAAIQFAGLAAVWLARRSEGSACQGICHVLCLASLAVVGISTVVCLLVDSGLWFASGVTLSVMVVATTYETTQSRRRAPHREYAVRR